MSRCCAFGADFGAFSGAERVSAGRKSGYRSLEARNGSTNRAKSSGHSICGM
jgi:hypothetical protein